jgi:hypothetical protein
MSKTAVVLESLLQRKVCPPAVIDDSMRRGEPSRSVLPYLSYVTGPGTNRKKKQSRDQDRVERNVVVENDCLARSVHLFAAVIIDSESRNIGRLVDFDICPSAVNQGRANAECC